MVCYNGLTMEVRKMKTVVIIVGVLVVVIAIGCAAVAWWVYNRGFM